MPIVFYELNDIHKTSDFYWNGSFHNQSRFLPYRHTPDGATRSKRRLGHVNDVECADSRGAVTSAPPAATAAASLPLPGRNLAQAAGPLRRLWSSHRLRPRTVLLF